MKLRWPFVRKNLRGHSVVFELRGQPPANASEEYIKKIMGAANSIPIYLLEQRLCESMFREELRHGAAAADIGMLGPGLFAPDAIHLLANIRPEFASVVCNPEVSESGEKEWDLCDLSCPLSQVKTMEILDSLASGESARIILSDKESAVNIAQHSKAKDFKLDFIQENRHRFILSINKQPE